MIPIKRTLLICAFIIVGALEIGYHTIWGASQGFTGAWKRVSSDLRRAL